MDFFSNNKYDIIIVGGGISGLFTGYKLSDTGLNILIIESNSRLGGRINTIYKRGYNYESGAARFHRKHTKLLSLIDELGLKNKIYPLSNEINYLIESPLKEKPDISVLFNKAIESQNDVKKNKLINITFYQYLILLFDFETAEYIKNAFGYDSEIIHLNAYAALKMFKDDLFGDNDYYTLDGGLSQIIKELEDRIEEKGNVHIITESSLKEINKDSIILEGGEEYYFENLVLTIPQMKLKEIEYFKGNKLLDSVKPIKLLRIYAQYPTDDLWFKDIKRTITNNYIRHIIPINYDKGLIMISYTDDIYSKMWESYNKINKKLLIKTLHKEIIELFGINPPDPKMVSTHYWTNGYHMWYVGSDIDKIYPSIIKPNEEDNIYIIGESYSKKQGWIEGSLETCYDLIKEIDIEGIQIISK